MNILVFCQYYYPEQFLINEIAEHLVANGNQVTVVTGLPNYPSGVIDKNYRHGKKRDEMINGVRVVRCPIVARGHSKGKLLLNYFSYMFLAEGRAAKLDEQFDVVFLYQLTPIFQAYPAIKYCKTHSLKLLMYNCDLAPMSGSGIISKLGFLARPYAKFSRWAMNNCDAICVTSKSFLDYNHEVNAVPYEKMIYLPQHASEKMLELDLSAENNNISDFMFAGNIGKGAALDTVVKAVQSLDQIMLDKIRIHIVGDGSFLQELKEKVHENGLDDVFVFHGRYPMSEMPKMYKLADALLITLRKGQITIPSKLQTYMTTGKPILGSMDGSGKEMIEEAKCGVCVPAEDYVQLAEAMISYANSVEKYKECGSSGKKYFMENFTLKKYLDRLTAVLNDLV